MYIKIYFPFSYFPFQMVISHLKSFKILRRLYNHINFINIKYKIFSEKQVPDPK